LIIEASARGNGYKHNSKRIDRLLGSGSLHTEVPKLYKALARKSLAGIFSRTTMSSTPFLLIPLRLPLALALALAAPWVCADETGARAVTFSLYAPQAKSVEVAGDFNQWQSGATPLAGPDEKGMWRVKLTLPATLNRIEYVYWVDGASRRIDPGQLVVQDGFAGENNVLVLP